MPPLLSAAQVGAFKANGHLQLNGLVPASVLAGWRAQFWAAIEADQADPAGWPGNLADSVLGVHAQASTNQPGNPLSPALGHLPLVQQVVAELGGGCFAEGQRPALTAAEAEEVRLLRSWCSHGCSGLGSGDVACVSRCPFFNRQAAPGCCQNLSTTSSRTSRRASRARAARRRPVTSMGAMAARAAGGRATCSLRSPTCMTSSPAAAAHPSSQGPTCESRAEKEEQEP